MKPRALIAAVLFAAAFCGCGGGGRTPQQNTGGTIVTLNTQPDKPTTERVGDFEVTIPAKTFAKPAQVTISTNTPTEVPLQTCGFAPADRGQLRISTSCDPIGAITVKPTRTIQRASGKTVWRYICKGADGLWHIVSDVANDTTILINKEAFSAAHFVDGIVGSFFVTPPQTSTGLVTLATNPTGMSCKALLSVNGFNNTAEDLRLADQRFCAYKQEYMYSKAFGFSYDYRLSPSVSAQALAVQLNKLAVQGFTYIDILAHSEGAIVVRDAIENRRCNAYPISAFLICGPNLGSSWTTPALFVQGLEEAFINDPGITSSPILSTFGDPVIQDLAPGSSYLNQLNAPGNGHPVWTNYTIVGAVGDKIVGPHSGDPFNSGFPLYQNITSEINFNRKITGTVISRMLGDVFCGHSSLVRTQTGLDQLLSNVYTRLGTFASIETSPNQVVGLNNGSWNYSLILSNSDVTVTVQNILIEDYAANGSWIRNRSIADTSGRLVNGYAECRFSLIKNRNIYFSMHESPSPGQECGYRIIIARFINQFGDQRTWLTQLALRNGSTMPATPNLRTRPTSMF